MGEMGTSSTDRVGEMQFDERKSGVMGMSSKN